MNVKPVNGAVAAYMAKYMSKGKQMLTEARKDWGEENCPRTWWNMTRPCREMIKSETFGGREAGALLEAILNYAWDTDPQEVYAFLRHIDLVFDGVTYTAGWRGRFHEQAGLEVRAMLKSVYIDRLP